MTEFLELANALEEITSTPRRNEKIRIIADILKSVKQDELQFTTRVLAGRVFAESDERTLNVSWSGMMSALKKIIDYSEKDFGEFYQGDVGEAIASMFTSGRYSKQQSLFSQSITISTLQRDLEQMSSFTGKGSKSERETLVAKIFMDASPLEIRHIVALILGDTRTGVSDALVLEGIAKAFEIDPDIARRAWNFSGSLGEVASVAARRGEDGVKRIGVTLFRPIKPMLATPAANSEEILSTSSDPFIVEYKYDGARVQIHKLNQQVCIYSRRLNEVTQSMPEIVEMIQSSISAKSAILDGEVIAVDDKQNPYPFQIVMKRFGRSKEVEEISKDIKLKLILFDVILVEGEMVVNKKLSERKKILKSIASEELITPYKESISSVDIEEMFKDSKTKGHEGLMLKNINSAYIPGKRGKNWFKLKHTLETLDLVIIAAEWGHGRRKDWLSDYHLGVWDADAGEFISVGKTFKGLTDEELTEMTKRLQEIAISSTKGLVRVRPEIVVEIVAAEIQESPTYNSGFALRFARISRIRDDLDPSDSTTLEELRELFETQFKYKAR
ncbi:MAG: ATP-dependent DNA ligase [Candidatus Thorarchaeota archaeon]